MIEKSKQQVIDEFLESKRSDDSYDDIFLNSVNVSAISFQTDKIGMDWTYGSMHLVAQQFLLSILQRRQKPRCTLLDVGSQFSFISFAAAFCDVVCVEPRIQQQIIKQEGVCNIEKISGEAQALPLESDRFDIVTSMHAIEHFGLGRYGDTPDYYGDQRGLAEFARVLTPGGHLLAGVPSAKKSTIEFNGQRKYNPDDFDKIVAGAGLVKVDALLAFPHFTFQEGAMIANPKLIDHYPEQHTPPVYIGVYQKLER